MNTQTAFSLWELALENRDLLKVSVVIEAQTVRDLAADPHALTEAVTWCKQAGITRVFVESWRGILAEREALECVQSRFLEEGFEVSGCVMPVGIGKVSSSNSHWSCFTSAETRAETRRIFEYTASIFDEIIIDDALFTDCDCPECRAARGDRSISEYHRDLMNRVSQEDIIAPSRAVNPKVRLILKYPQWYDDFHRRGYDVLEQTAAYDGIWVGTEVRSYDEPRWGRKVPYQSFWIMRWFNSLAGEKNGGGWFDPLDTPPDIFLEQARQTVLGDALEMAMWSYRVLREERGPEDIQALRGELQGLFELARLVRGKPLRKGILAPKPGNSAPYPDHDATPGFWSMDADGYIFDFIGMMGLPLIPATAIDTRADALFGSMHLLKDPSSPARIAAMLAQGKPVLITDGLAAQLEGQVNLADPNLIVLPLRGDPHRTLQMTRAELALIRDQMLAPLGMRFDAPNKVALYPVGDDLLVIENFTAETVDATLEASFVSQAHIRLVLPSDRSILHSFVAGRLVLDEIPPHTLVAIEYR